MSSKLKGGSGPSSRRHSLCRVGPLSAALDRTARLETDGRQSRRPTSESFPAVVVDCVDAVSWSAGLVGHSVPKYRPPDGAVACWTCEVRFRVSRMCTRSRSTGNIRMFYANRCALQVMTSLGHCFA